MRAHEFVNEATKPGSMPVDADQKSVGVYKMRDIGGYDRFYHLNRIMMAAAMADGSSTDPVDMDSSSWYEKYNTAHPYSEKEHIMMQAAMNTIPTDGKNVVSDHKSKELDDTYKVSPLPSRNKLK